MIIFTFRNEQDDINIVIVPHISMANKSSWSMPQDPTGDYDVPPHSLRTSTLAGNSDDTFESDNELAVNNEMPSNSAVLHDLTSASNSVVQPDAKENAYKSKRPRMSLPQTPLENSLHNLVVSGSQLPAYSQDTEENIHDYEQIDEQLSSPGGCKKISYALPDIQNPQKKSSALTHTKNKAAEQKDKHDHVQGDKRSDEEGYVIEQIDFKPPVTRKMDQPSDESEGYVIEQIDFRVWSSYLKIFATRNGTISDDDDDRSEYYEWCEIQQLQKLSPMVPVAATTRSGDFVGCSSVHQISQLYDADTMACQCTDASHSVALSGERTYSDTTSPTTEIKQSNISELRRVDSTTSDYIRMHKASNLTIKGNSHVYTYDHTHHSCVQMCKHRRQCTSIPPRRIEHTKCLPSFPVNTKTHKTYANFEIIENHTISLLPHAKHNRPTPKRCTNYKPPMPPRNIPRPGCYLSAPSAVASY